MKTAEAGISAPCGNIVGALVTDFPFRAPALRLARVEIRQCEPQGTSLIQIVAWSLGAGSPSLIIDTGDFGVVQEIARANVFVIETGGATRDQVFAIVFERGTPKLAAKWTTRGTANVVVRRDAIDVEITGIYAGIGAEHTERRSFKLNLGDLSH